MIVELYQRFKESTGVCTDTRKLETGQLFFALKGPNFNGNQYAAKALESGAMLAIVDEEEFAANDQDYLLVDDVLAVLQSLATHHRQQFDIPILGITGSNGKTTTKELLARVLRSKYRIHYTQGNLNNHIGVPLTLLAMPEDTEIAIIEMGANHVGDIAELCSIALPTCGLITNIGNAHLGEFGGRENLIRAKSELFDHLRRTKGDVFINMEDEVLSNMAKRFPDAYRYPNNTLQLASAKPFVHYYDDKGQEHATELIGAYNYHNMAAAVTVAMYFEVENPYEMIDRYVPDNNRSQVIQLGSNTVVLDAYNANPSSMIAALQNLDLMMGTKKIALLGAMKELGHFADEEHAKVAAYANALNIDVLFVGEEFRSCVEQSTFYTTVDDLMILFEKEPLSGATVLIKGSRSQQMEKLAQNKKLWI